MEYSIANLRDMASIPPEARARMLAELPSMLDNLAKILASGVPISLDACRWTDDGDHTTTFVVNELAGRRRTPKRARPGTDARGANATHEGADG